MGRSFQWKRRFGRFGGGGLAALTRSYAHLSGEATIWPVRVSGACSFNAFVRDISERRQAEQARKRETALIQLLQAVTTAANRSSSMGHTAKVCLGLICSYTGWPVGHVCLTANGSPQELLPAGIWHLEDAGRFREFRETSDRMRLS